MEKHVGDKNRQETVALDPQARRELRHDLRTPINAIMGLTGLLLEEVDGPLSSEQRVQIALILDAARSLSELVDNHLSPTAGVANRRKG